jgi:hypothetical protein
MKENELSNEKLSLFLSKIKTVFHKVKEIQSVTPLDITLLPVEKKQQEVKYIVNNFEVKSENNTTIEILPETEVINNNSNVLIEVVPSKNEEIEYFAENIMYQEEYPDIEDEVDFEDSIENFDEMLSEYIEPEDLDLVSDRNNNDNVKVISSESLEDKKNEEFNFSDYNTIEEGEEINSEEIEIVNSSEIKEKENKTQSLSLEKENDNNFINDMEDILGEDINLPTENAENESLPFNEDDDIEIDELESNYAKNSIPDEIDEFIDDDYLNQKIPDESEYNPKNDEILKENTLKEENKKQTEIIAEQALPEKSTSEVEELNDIKEEDFTFPIIFAQKTIEKIEKKKKQTNEIFDKLKDDNVKIQENKIKKAFNGKKEDNKKDNLKNTVKNKTLVYNIDEDEEFNDMF